MNNRDLITKILSVMKSFDEVKYEKLVNRINSIADDNFYYEIDREEELTSCFAEDELFSRTAIIVLMTSHFRKNGENYIKDIIKEISNDK